MDQKVYNLLRLALVLSCIALATSTVYAITGTFTQTLPNVYTINHKASGVQMTSENYLFAANAIQLTLTATAAVSDTMQINILSSGSAPCPQTNSCLFQYNLVFTASNLTATNAYLIPATISLQSLPASSVTTISL